MSTDVQTETPTSPDAVWRATVRSAINEALGLDLTYSVDAYTAANIITNGVSDLHKWQGQAADVARSVTAERDELAGKLADAVTERDNSRAFSNQLLEAQRGYNQTLADHLGVPYGTAADAAALCDALIPRLMTESAAVESAAFAATVLPDVLPADDDGDAPSPACTIRLLTNALRAARRSAERTNDALNVARAEADGLRASHAKALADLLATDRARDSWRDAAAASARALSTAAAALADVAAIR
jgi:hypothetical protein